MVKYLHQLQKVQRLTDSFTVKTVRASTHLLASGKELDSEALTDLAIKLQELEALIGLTLIRVKC